MMTDPEMVKAGLDAALAPVRDTFNRLLGPVADELGGILADPVRVFRFRQSVRLLEKVKRLAEEAGFELNAVPLKSLLPILENASTEDDEDLHDRWANLLANAARELGDQRIYATFADILRLLTPDQARLVDVIHEISFAEIEGVRVLLGGEWNPLIATTDRATLASLWLRANELYGISGPALMDRRFHLALANLEKLGILTRMRSRTEDFMERIRMDEEYFYTGLGLEFVTACRRPKAA